MAKRLLTDPNPALRERLIQVSLKPFFYLLLDLEFSSPLSLYYAICIKGVLDFLPIR